MSQQNKFLSNNNQLGQDIGSDNDHIDSTLNNQRNLNDRFEQLTVDDLTSSAAQPQREPVNVYPSDFGGYMLHPEYTMNQSSELKRGPEDMISRHHHEHDNNMKKDELGKLATAPPQNMFSKKEEHGYALPAQNRDSRHEKDITFFGDSLTTESHPQSRSSLDQDSLFRGSITTLPSAGKRRSSSANKQNSHIMKDTSPISSSGGLSSHPVKTTTTTIISSTVPADIKTERDNKANTREHEEDQQQQQQQHNNKNSLANMASAAASGVVAAASGAAATLLGTNTDSQEKDFNQHESMPSTWPQKGLPPSSSSESQKKAKSSPAALKDATNSDYEPAIHGQSPCFHTHDNISKERVEDKTHPFCRNVQEPSIHGERPSYQDNNQQGIHPRVAAATDNNPMRSDRTHDNPIDNTHKSSSNITKESDNKHAPFAVHDSKGIDSKAITANDTSSPSAHASLGSHPTTGILATELNTPKKRTDLGSTTIEEGQIPKTESNYGLDKNKQQEKDVSSSSRSSQGPLTARHVGTTDDRSRHEMGGRSVDDSKADDDDTITKSTSQQNEGNGKGLMSSEGLAAAGSGIAAAIGGLFGLGKHKNKEDDDYHHHDNQDKWDHSQQQQHQANTTTENTNNLNMENLPLNHTVDQAPPMDKEYLVDNNGIKDQHAATGGKDHSGGTGKLHLDNLPLNYTVDQKGEKPIDNNTFPQQKRSVPPVHASQFPCTAIGQTPLTKAAFNNNEHPKQSISPVGTGYSLPEQGHGRGHATHRNNNQSLSHADALPLGDKNTLTHKSFNDSQHPSHDTAPYGTGFSTVVGNRQDTTTGSQYQKRQYDPTHADAIPLSHDNTMEHRSFHDNQHPQQRVTPFATGVGVAERHDNDNNNSAAATAGHYKEESRQSHHAEPLPLMDVVDEQQVQQPLSNQSAENTYIGDSEHPQHIVSAPPATGYAIVGQQQQQQQQQQEKKDYGHYYPKEKQTSDNGNNNTEKGSSDHHSGGITQTLMDKTTSALRQMGLASDKDQHHHQDNSNTIESLHDQPRSAYDVNNHQKYAHISNIENMKLAGTKGDSTTNDTSNNFIKKSN